jgi:hypothetical protein
LVPKSVVEPEPDQHGPNLYRQANRRQRLLDSSLDPRPEVLLEAPHELIDRVLHDLILHQRLRHDVDEVLPATSRLGAIFAIFQLVRDPDKPPKGVSTNSCSYVKLPG